MASPQITTVAIVGATGHLGPSILHELITAFPSVRVLARESSTSTIPPSSNLTITKLPDSYPVDALTVALHGVDALVSTLPASTLAIHRNLVSACVAARVRRFIPTDYGSVHADDPEAQRLVPLYKAKTDIRALCVQTAAEHGDTFSWSALVCGHFFDWGLANGLLGFDVREKRALMFDGGAQTFSASTLPQIGRAVVASLRNLDASRGKVCRVQSFCTSQKEVLGLLQQASGSTWRVEQVDSATYVEREAAKMNAGDHEARENVVCVLGLLRSEWNAENEMCALGLPEEDLEKIVGEVWAASSGI